MSITEKVDVEHSSPQIVAEDQDPAVVRKVLLKTDIRVLPILTLLFLCSFLDRTNVGNAKIVGLEEDIGITDHQYDIGLTVFYLFYICSELPSNLVLKKASPRVWLPFLTILWGAITVCLGFVKNFASFVAVRALLGFAEGGLLPGMVLYLSWFYARSDLAVRIGLFYTATSLSGAFGGLLARGLVEIGPRGGLEGWRWIFIIEGLLTVVCGAVAAIALPNNIESAKYLTPEERKVALQRIRRDDPHNTGDVENETFKVSEVLRGIRDLRMWLSALAYFSILVGLYSFGLFLPTIINETGLPSNPNEAQLWSVIPYAVAALFTVIVAIVSDRIRLRGVMMLITLPFAIAGYAAIANITAPRIRYGMTFLMATGMYSSVPCILVWNSNNSAGSYKRATTSAVQLAIANCSGFVATFIYPARDKPLFRRGHNVSLGLLVAAWFLILANVLYCAKINRDKRLGKYDKYAGLCNDDRHPDFKLML
ncbi:hypothetical protein VTN49DRAFT_5434 [Thermomyces lanuginosus]|uniref:uncharacterized protein n=1 Tax=Thermomyces lanuginosus TaxID=5541 RepID=UPI003742D695